MAPNFWDTFRRHLAAMPPVQTFFGTKGRTILAFSNTLVPHVIFIYFYEGSLHYSCSGGVVHYLFTAWRRPWPRSALSECRASRTGPLAWKRQNWLDFGSLPSPAESRPPTSRQLCSTVRHLICACNIIYRKCTKWMNNERTNEKKTCSKLFTIHYYFLGFSFL